MNTEKLLKSPFTGGAVTIHTREEEVTFRGEKIKINRQYYRCEDTGREFTDSNLDDDMMWTVFRKYCEKKGIESFKDIVLLQEQPIQINTLTWKDINDIERIINNVHYEFRNGIGEKSFGEEVLERFREERDEQELPEVDLEKFTEKIDSFKERYKNNPERVSIKGAMAFMARMFYQYPSVAREWYENLPKATMD